MLDRSKAIIDSENAWVAALLRGDQAYLEGLLAPDYQLVVAVAGLPLQIIDRTRQLAVGGDYNFESITIEDISVRDYDTVLVASLIWTQRASLRGQDRSGSFMISDVWRLNGAAWQIVDRHSSRPEAGGGVRP